MTILHIMKKNNEASKTDCIDVMNRKVIVVMAEKAFYA